MNSEQYIKMQLDLVEYGELNKIEANDKIVGFLNAENGVTWDSYRAAQRELVEWEYVSRQKANNRLHGFRDYIRLNEKEQA